MREWKFENGIEVIEKEFDYDLHCFKVYNGEKYLGTVYPADIEDMEGCIERLDDGYNPVNDGWEDGMGNRCSIEGWENDNI